MAVGDKIRTVDYNSVQTKVANILGTGSGSLGYGQTVQSSQVTTSNNITVNEWGNLRNDIINIYRHQNNSIPDTSVLPEATEGASIRYNVSDAPVTVWDTLVNTLEANRVNALPVGRFGTTSEITFASSLYFTEKAEIDCFFFWNDETTARHFFNGGGRLRVRHFFNNPLNEPTSQIITWQTFLDTVGNVEWGGFYPDTGVSGTDGRNYHKSDGTLREFYRQSVSAPYGVSELALQAAKFFDVGRNQYCVQIRTILDDKYTDLPLNDTENPYPYDRVNVNQVGSAASTIYPTGAMTGLGTATWTEYRSNGGFFSGWNQTGTAI